MTGLTAGRTEAVVFDFDGVLAESVDIKTEAFRDLYGDFGDDVVERVVAHHEDHGGISRFEKIRHYHAEFLGKNLSAEELAAWTDRFSRLVEDKVVGSAWVAGARAFLDELDAAGIPLFVASGTPEDELLRIIERRGMRAYFTAIGGAPRTKQEILEAFLNRHGFDRSNVLMIGDARTDYEAAIQCSVPFVGRSAGSAKGQFPNSAPAVNDLTQLFLDSDGRVAMQTDL